MPSDSVNMSALSPTNLIAASAVLIMAFGGGWTLMQSQFTDVKEREKLLLDRIEKLETNEQKSAHEPVEKATIDAIMAAQDKRTDLIQAQITDINRQIAAALIIIDNNSSNGGKKPLPNPQ